MVVGLCERAIQPREPRGAVFGVILTRLASKISRVTLIVVHRPVGGVSKSNMSDPSNLLGQPARSKVGCMLRVKFGHWPLTSDTIRSIGSRKVVMNKVPLGASQNVDTSNGSNLVGVFGWVFVNLSHQ